MNVFYANSGYEEASAALLRALELATAAGDDRSAADALQLLGLAAYNNALWSSDADYAQPLEYFQQALARRKALEDWRGVAESLFYSGLISERREQPDEAQSYYTKALALASKHDHPIEKSYALRHLAGIAEEAGNLEQALALYGESLALREAAGYTILLPLSHLAVGDVLLAQRDLPQAMKHYQAAYAIAQEMETPVARIFCLLSLGGIHRQAYDPAQARSRSLYDQLYHPEHELAQARSCYEQARALAQEIAFPLGITAASTALEEIARLENIRETITTSAEARGRYVKQTAGPGIYGDVWLRVEPLERGKGFAFVNALAAGVLPDEFMQAAEQGVQKALESGGPAGYPLTDLRVTLFNGSFHEVDSSERAFIMAAAMALQAAVEQAQPIVLKPDPS